MMVGTMYASWASPLAVAAVGRTKLRFLTQIQPHPTQVSRVLLPTARAADAVARGFIRLKSRTKRQAGRSHKIHSGIQIRRQSSQQALAHQNNIAVVIAQKQPNRYPIVFQSGIRVLLSTRLSCCYSGAGDKNSKRTLLALSKI